MDRLRILFVDDEEELVSAVVERLEIRGLEASGAANGADALHKLDQQRFDVVVVDVRMPEMSGLVVLQRVRQLHPTIKVILLTGHGSTQDAEEGLRLGAFAYLQKPVDIEHLVDLIRKAADEPDRGACRG